MSKRDGRPASAAPREPLLIDPDKVLAFMGLRTQSQIRHLIERRQIPFRRLGGRIVFLRRELEAFLARAPGCSVEEAVRNAGREREASRQ